MCAADPLIKSLGVWENNPWLYHLLLYSNAMTETNTTIDQFAIYNGKIVRVVGYFPHESGNTVFISHNDGSEEEVPFSALDLL